METPLKNLATSVMRDIAKRLVANIMSGHDHPNTQEEIDRMNGDSFLRKAADELDKLRGQRMVLMQLVADVAEVIHNLPDEVETQEEADAIGGLKDRIADARSLILLDIAANHS